jgi:hypothetical protein
VLSNHIRMNTWMMLSIIVSAFLESTVAHDHVLKERLDVSVTLSMSDYGRHILIHDACTKDNKTYLVGGATTLHSTALGMDAFLFVYDGTELTDVHSYGGINQDQFTNVVCADTLVVAGHSNSADFLGVPGVNNFSRAFVMELSYEGDVVKQYVSAYAFESLIHGLDVSARGITAVGQAKRITSSDFLIMHITNHQLTEQVFGGEGIDVLYDVHHGESMVVVGQTSSSLYQATGPRGIIFELASDLSIQRSVVLMSSSESAYHYVDETYLAGTSSHQGIVQRRGEVGVTIIPDSTLIHGRYQTTWYGAGKQGGFIQDRPATKGEVISIVPHFIVLQHEGMLYQASLVIPHVFRKEEDTYLYNDQVVEFETIEFWEDAVFHQQRVAYVGAFMLIVENNTTRKIPTCNVKPQVYYHPVTVLCNQEYWINNVFHQESVVLRQPGSYRLTMDENDIVFTIAQVELPIVEVDYQPKQVIAITPRENRMWMIPAAWFGLFVGKKYLG